MDLKRTSKWFIISGALVIWTIKFIIRPLNLFDDPTRFFFNIAPNLLGSFLIPFGAYWFFSGRNFLVARLFRIESGYDLRLVCMLGFGMLVVNEYLQLISFFGRTFDINDIYFSSVGLLISYFVFGRLQARKAKTFLSTTN
jgi:glycopeptide antibiotics resistance protein